MPNCGVVIYLALVLCGSVLGYFTLYTGGKADCLRQYTSEVRIKSAVGSDEYNRTVLVKYSGLYA